jgi:hypothetical protein
MNTFLTPSKPSSVSRYITAVCKLMKKQLHSIIRSKTDAQLCTSALFQLLICNSSCVHYTSIQLLITVLMSRPLAPLLSNWFRKSLSFCYGCTTTLSIVDQVRCLELKVVVIQIQNRIEGLKYQHQQSFPIKKSEMKNR